MELVQNDFIDMSKSEREIVILVHGLARSSGSMLPLARGLEKKGYQVVNLDYPSTRMNIEEIALRFLHPVVQAAQAESRAVHFVTHSMGGIIVRWYLGHYRIQRVGRVVMLAPPNQGSELVDVFKSSFLFKKVLGPAGQQLSTAHEALPNRLGPAHFDLGIIAGNISCNLLSPWLFEGAGDGKVALGRTLLSGMQDMLVVPCNHTFIMRSRKVIDQTIVFLQTGGFTARQTTD